jgi:putative DNA methylase
MSSRVTYPKRLIEVDLPIKRISAHARREKSIRQGHISTLHIWWARRPLAACRAVICAALWPDPADSQCPRAFIRKAREEMLAWAPHERQKLLSEESRKRFENARKTPDLFDDARELRGALFDFIADFANWDNSTVREYLDTSRALTQAAHEALGGAPGTRPLVVDPFAGGGSIPLEALRVGADAFASDLNPVPVILNKVVLEYIPKYGQRLADEFRKWSEWIRLEGEKELGKFYPKDADGASPFTYLWARTIRCEGPGCGAEVPLIRSLWLAKKVNRSVALQLVSDRKAKSVAIQIIVKQSDGWVDQADPRVRIENPQLTGTSKAASATCPSCGFTTPKASVRQQLCQRRGGANDAKLLCVVTTRDDQSGRTYRLPTDADFRAIEHATKRLQEVESKAVGKFSVIPDEKIPQERV